MVFGEPDIVVRAEGDSELTVKIQDLDYLRTCTRNPPRDPRSHGAMAKRTPKDLKKWVQLAVPPEFHIGIRGMAERARWRVRREGGETLVATEERYQNQVPALLRLRLIATTRTANDSRSYEPLSRWRRQDEYRQEPIAARVQELDEVKNPQSATDSLVSLRLQFLTVRDADVASFTQAIYSRLCSDMPQSKLWAIEFDDALAWRVAAVRLLFAAREHPEQLAKVHENGERLMNPMSLMPRFGYGLGAFVEPALLIAAPWLIGMNAMRIGGQLVFMFGEAMPSWTGRQSDAPLDLLRGDMPHAWLPDKPDASAKVVDAWLKWWVGRLNTLLDLALDIANFQDADGRYEPALQLALLASLERLFSGVQSVLAAAQRPRNRLEGLFGVIDLLSGLSFGSWENMLRPDQATRHLAQLRTVLPTEAEALALARCEHAVDSLEELAAGFGPLTDGRHLRIPRAKGAGTDDVSVDAATHQYLRLIRNAGTHSFRQHVREPRSRAILAAHQGDIPDGVADLAILHLLRFLASPTLTRT